MIYALIIQYENGINSKNGWHYRPSDHDAIYERMMELTGNDHEISADAASWCELATVGEIYEFREGEIEIVEIN